MTIQAHDDHISNRCLRNLSDIARSTEANDGQASTLFWAPKKSSVYFGEYTSGFPEPATRSVERGWGGEVQSLCLPRPLKYHIIPITETSILSRIHATAHTPDTVVKGLTNAEHVASAEAHPPREGRILHMCRR